MLFIRRFLALILAIVGLLGFDFSAAELNFDNAIVSEKRDYRFDNDRLLIGADGNRTNTYYAVQTVNNEIAPFKELYADFEHIGTFLTNGGRAVGTNSGYLTPMTEKKGCCLLTTAPVLTGCFKKDDARGYVFVNMFFPDNGKSANICVTFDEAENITVYRKGNVTRTEGNTLKLTLENNEGIFVTVE